MSQKENNKPNEIIEDEIKAEMEANTAMQAYFKQFASYSVATFIDCYARDKKWWINYGKRNVDKKEYHSIKWVTKAADHLATIQQKKMFDMQCLWRAEKINIPQVQLCYDFKIWEKDILNCPFLEPVNEDDIHLYAQYLQSDNAIDDDENGRWSIDEWQDYDEIKNAYNNEDADRNFPEWYDFYNSRRGTGVYMILPDIRGEKEEFYMELARKEERSKNPQPPYIPENYLWYTDVEKRDWFIKTFETKEIQEFYAAYEWSQRNAGLREDLEYYLYTLYEADEPVAMEANMDWAEAIKRTAIKYRNQKIAEALPQAWEQYMLNIQMGIAFENERKFTTKDTIRKIYEEGIIKSRKLNGELEDLEF